MQTDSVMHCYLAVNAWYTLIVSKYYTLRQNISKRVFFHPGPYLRNFTSLEKNKKKFPKFYWKKCQITRPGRILSQCVLHRIVLVARRCQHALDYLPSLQQYTYVQGVLLNNWILTYLFTRSIINIVCNCISTFNWYFQSCIESGTTDWLALCYASL